jgi:hypothetical protein
LQPVASKQPERNERKYKMTTQPITQDLRNPCGKGYEKVPVRQRNFTANLNEQEDCQPRTSLWELLFQHPWWQSLRERTGAEMRSFVVSIAGGSYTVTDNQRSLAAAAHAGPVSSLEEVWRNTVR